MTSKTDKVDIFEVLGKISDGDLAYIHSLTQAQKKTLAPVVLLRWLTGVRNAKQIKYLNSFVNPLVFSLYQHQDLLLKLMMSSTVVKGQRFKWIKKKPNEKISLSLDVIQRYYKCSPREAKEYLPLISADDLIEMASILGEDNKFIDDLKKNELDV